MATQNAPVVELATIQKMRADLGLPPLPESDEPNFVDRAMDAATMAAKDIGEEVADFAANPDRIPTLLLGYFLGAGTVLITLLATRLF